MALAVSLTVMTVSLLAIVSSQAESWNLNLWNELRDAGFCAVLAPFCAPDAALEVGIAVFTGPVAGPWAAVDGPSIQVLDEAYWETLPRPTGWLLDSRGHFQNYSSHRSRQAEPWGWIAGHDVSEADLLSCACAACACGAQLIAVPVAEPAQVTRFAASLKPLVLALGHEIKRVPKRPEGHSFRAGMMLDDDHGGRFLAGEARYKVAFQGEAGAYSEMAIFNLFPPAQTSAIPNKTFRDAFQAVDEGRLDFAMIPFENALAGPVQDSYDLLWEFRNLTIVAETQVRVEHNLIGLPGTRLADIRRVFSHPQALAQSRQFLESHPEMEAQPFYDTAGSVGWVKKNANLSWAAIASAEAARVWNLEILVAGIETNHSNYTRFFLLAGSGAKPVEAANKASVLFSTPDTPGALSRCLAVFSNHGLNMKKLESRPILGKPWEYMFYVDVDLPEDPRAFEAAWNELEGVSLDLRLLGRYPSGRRPSPDV